MTTSSLSMPRLGAAFASPRASAGVRAFGVVSSDGAAAGLRPPTTSLGSWSTGCVGAEHLWMIGSSVRERVWWAPAPEESQGVGNRDGGRRSVMRLRVSTTDSAGGTAYELDLGQSLELYAQALQVKLLAPEGAVVVTDVAVEPRRGLLFESRCMIRLLQLEASRGVSSALLTETIFVPSGAPHLHRVPSGARHLTAYVESPPDVPVMRWQWGDPSTAITLGTIAWPSNQPQTELDVPSASHLRIEAAEEDRTFTFVWTVVP